MAVVISRKESRKNIERAIIAIMWYFGFSRKKALKYMGETSREVIDSIVQSYEGNAKAVFYND